MTERVPYEIDVATLDRMRRTGASYTILDVREPREVNICRFDGAIHIPMRDVPQSLGRLPEDHELVVVCHHGVRSLQVMAWLRGNGFDKATSLKGGINAWARDIDPSMKTY